MSTLKRRPDSEEDTNTILDNENTQHRNLFSLLADKITSKSVALLKYSPTNLHPSY